MKYVDESALQRRHSHTEDDHPPSPVAVGGEGESGGLRFHAPQTPPSNPLTPASPHGPTSNQPQQFLQSPPSSVRQPSPQQPSPAGPAGSGFAAPSPANPIGSVGSPFPSAQSPAGGPGGSPAPRPSPRQTTGLSPAPQGASSHSTSSSRPSARLLPQRLWAGAHPTPLTASAFDDICRPGKGDSVARPEQGMPAPPQPSTAMTLAPLHRFLGSLFLRKTLVVSFTMVKFKNCCLL